MGRSDTPDPGELALTQAGDIAEDQAEHLRIALRAPAKARGEPIGEGIRRMSEAPIAGTVASALAKRVCWPQCWDARPVPAGPPGAGPPCLPIRPGSGVQHSNTATSSTASNSEKPPSAVELPNDPSDLPAESSHRRAILGRRGAKRQLWVPVPPLPLPFGVPRMFPRDRLGSTERQGRSRQRLSVSFLPVRVVRPCTLNTRRDLKGTLAKLG